MGSPLLSRHGDFDIPEPEIYLDGAYMSPLPHSARSAVETAYQLKSRPYLVPYEKFFEYPDAVRERLARALDVPVDEVGITNSTGQGAMLLAQGLRWEPGDRVLLGPDEFPSNVYPWLALRERGVEVEIIGERGSGLQIEQLEAALTRGRVRLVALAAVHYTTGDLHPLAEMSRLVHEHDALLITDATQACGSVDVKWTRTGVDALLTSGYKWLLGPYGTGAAYERARDLRALLDYAEVPVHGRLLDSGETASFLNLAAWWAGLDYLNEIGAQEIERHHRALQDRLVAQLDRAEVRVVSGLSATHRSPMLYLEGTGNLDAERLQDELAAAHVRLSVRGGRIRVSPGIWNRETDVDALARVIHTVAGRT
jgi:selenocysteine lyase/cysteine desulfurase